MANVNLENKRIFGAKEGTKKYYHEVGHLVFEEYSDYGNKIRVIQDLSIKFLLFIIALNLLYSWIGFKIITLILLLTNIYSEIYEEAWCWKFAKLKMRNRDDKQTL